jgi:hypothetical protein
MKQTTALYEIFLIYYYHAHTVITAMAVSYHRYRKLIAVLEILQISEQYYLQGYNTV